jgi:hypothetical protein
MMHFLVACPSLLASPSALAPGLRMAAPVMQLRDTQRPGMGSSAYGTPSYQNNEYSGRVVSTRQPNNQYQSQSRNGQYNSQYQTQPINSQFQTQPRTTNQYQTQQVNSQFQTQPRSNQFQTQSRTNQFQTSRTNQFGANQFGAQQGRNQQDRYQQGRYRTSQDNEILVQGGSLRTWSYRNPAVDEVNVELSTEGRPLDADIELWHGPDNTPVKMRVYVENGAMRPFSCVIATPRGPNTIALRNIGQLEFPFAANVDHQRVERPTEECLRSFTTIQGGALRTYPFESVVETVQVMLKTDGRPLNARIELLQGPNNNKQVIELYTEDGLSRPFFCTLRTPGSGNVVRIVNTAPVEFPMTASVVPAFIDFNKAQDAVLGGDGVVLGGDMTW